MTIDSTDDSKISNRTITTNRISNRTYDSKSNRITKLRRSIRFRYHIIDSWLPVQDPRGSGSGYHFMIHYLNKLPKNCLAFYLTVILQICCYSVMSLHTVVLADELHSMLQDVHMHALPMVRFLSDFLPLIIGCSFCCTWSPSCKHCEWLPLASRTWLQLSRISNRHLWVFVCYLLSETWF